MNTVFTPDALNRSFVAITLAEFASRDDVEEGFFFLFPSRNIINEVNGDGDLVEVLDYGRNLSYIDTDFGPLAADKDTKIYIRRESVRRLKNADLERNIESGQWPLGVTITEVATELLRVRQEWGKIIRNSLNALDRIDTEYYVYGVYLTRHGPDSFSFRGGTARYTLTDTILRIIAETRK